MAALPAYVSILFDGYTERPAPAVNRTPMEDGMVKQAQTASRVLVTRPFKARIGSKAEHVLFETWFNDTIHRGTDWFDMTDPKDGVVKQTRFKGAVLEHVPKRKDMELWHLTGEVEIYA